MILNKKPLKNQRLISNGADEENRTPVVSLEGWGSTIELHPQLVDNINYTIFILSVKKKFQKNRTPKYLFSFYNKFNSRSFFTIYNDISESWNAY